MRVTDANRIVWRDSLPLAIAMLNGQGGYLPHVEGDGYRWLEWLCQQILPEPVGFLAWNEKSGQMEIRSGKEKPYFDRLYGLKKGCWIPDGTSARPAPEEWIHAAIQETDGEDYELQRSVHQGLTLHDLAHRFREQGLSLGKPQRRILGLQLAEALDTNLSWMLCDQRRYRVELLWLASRRRVGKLLYRGWLESSLPEMSHHLLDKIGDVCRMRRRRIIGEEGEEFPRSALMELFQLFISLLDGLSNAPWRLAFLEDRLELSVPGAKLPVSRLDASSGTTVCRNPHLMEIFQRLHPEFGASRWLYAEGGFFANRSGLTVRPGENRLTLVLPSAWRPRKRAVSPYADRSERLLELYLERGQLDRDTAARALDLSPRQATLLMHRMTREGLLREDQRVFRPAECICLLTD